jgi:arylsulfatase
MPFDEDVWELYDTRTDFGQATDVAAEHPDRLRELQVLFDQEARRYNVYPLSDNIAALLAADRPRLVSGNRASYGPGTVRLAEDAVLDIKNRSFSLVAEVEIPDGSADGVLVTLGGETGGYALLVLNGRPTFIYNFLGLERYTIASSEPLPTGACSIRFDFAYDGGGMGKGGTGTLSVNGENVGEVGS